MNLVACRKFEWLKAWTEPFNRGMSVNAVRLYHITETVHPPPNSTAAVMFCVSSLVRSQKFQSQIVGFIGAAGASRSHWDKFVEQTENNKPVSNLRE